MANIFDGSFVLGNVSATTLSAGEGIKITTDEPGVIKVSNDETVLWEGTSSQSANPTFILNEPATNFRYVDFYALPHNTNAIPVVVRVVSDYSSGTRGRFYNYTSTR